MREHKLVSGGGGKVMNRYHVTRALDDELASKALRSDGPLIDVELHLDCSDGAKCPPVRGKALVDTGADRTAIDFTQLSPGARPTGSFMAQGVTSESISLPVYPVRLAFAGSSLPSVDIEQAAATPHLRSQGIVALLGRDVLEHAQLTYDGPRGEFALSTAEGGMTVKSSGFPWGTVALLGVVGGLVAALILAENKKCPTDQGS